MIGYLCGSVTSGPKKSRELINSIMACDEASEESEFLSALNASLAHFVHKALKDEQLECIRRILCHGRDFLAVLPTGSFSSPEAAILLASATDRDLWPTQRSNTCACPWLSTSGLFPDPRCSARPINMPRNFWNEILLGIFFLSDESLPK